jgi:hypothetical protein
MIYHLLYPHYLGCAAAAVPQNGELAACGGCSWFFVLRSWLTPHRGYRSPVILDFNSN